MNGVRSPLCNVMGKEFISFCLWLKNVCGVEYKSNEIIGLAEDSSELNSKHSGCVMVTQFIIQIYVEKEQNVVQKHEKQTDNKSTYDNTSILLR